MRTKGGCTPSTPHTPELTCPRHQSTLFQAKRDTEMAARDAARQRLMDEVAAIREQQILERQLAK